MPAFTQHHIDRLVEQLHRDEGTNKDDFGNHVAYYDSATPPVLTIGYGHNCKASPVAGVTRPGDIISDQQANALFKQDLTAHIARLRRALPWVRKLDPVRQGVLYNMAFNLGVAGLCKWHNTLECVKGGDYASASLAMRSSRWALQVKERATRLAMQMETGEWQ